MVLPLCSPAFLCSTCLSLCLCAPTLQALGLKPKTHPVVQAPMDAKELAVLLKKKAEQEEIDAGGASGAGAGAAGASGLSEADRIKGLGFQ